WWDKFGTRVLFSDSSLSHTFPIEQFWGRAARASWVRKNLDARFNFPQNPTPLIHFAGPPLLDRCPLRSRLRSIRRNGEVHGDAGLSFNGLPVLEVGLEVPLLHRLASRGGQDAGTAENL